MRQIWTRPQRILGVVKIFRHAVEFVRHNKLVLKVRARQARRPNASFSTLLNGPLSGPRVGHRASKRRSAACTQAITPHSLKANELGGKERQRCRDVARSRRGANQSDEKANCPTAPRAAHRTAPTVASHRQN